MRIKNETLEVLLGTTRRQRTTTVVAVVALIGFAAGGVADLFFDGEFRVLVAVALSSRRGGSTFSVPRRRQPSRAGPTNTAVVPHCWPAPADLLDRIERALGYEEKSSTTTTSTTGVENTTDMP